MGSSPIGGTETKGHTLKIKNDYSSTGASAFVVALAGLTLAFVFVLLMGLLTWLILPLIFPTLGLGFWQCVMLAFLVRILTSSLSFTATEGTNKD